MNPVGSSVGQTQSKSLEIQPKSIYLSCLFSYRGAWRKFDPLIGVLLKSGSYHHTPHSELHSETIDTWWMLSLMLIQPRKEITFENLSLIAK